MARKTIIDEREVSTASTWCRICCTDHPPQARCPGDLRPTGPERPGWKITVETPRGMQGYGVLLTEVGSRWRARILTYPNVLWTVPGGTGSIKFLGRTPEEAERKAVAFIRQHCGSRSYLLRDELELVAEAPSPSVAADSEQDFDASRSPRFSRLLPVRFGKNRPTQPGRTENLSETGLFVATEHPMPEGKLVGLMLELEHAKVPLRGTVVWARHLPDPGRPPGMGLRLFNPPPIYTSYVHALA